MDLSTLDITASAEEGAVMELRHPASHAVLVDADKKPLTITLAGDDSERVRKAQRAATNRRLAMQGRRSGNKLTAEELEADGIDVLAAATVAWTGIVLDGQPLDCTPANAKTVYARLPWIREQAETFTADRANFLRASSTTSAPSPSTSTV